MWMPVMSTTGSVGLSEKPDYLIIGLQDGFERRKGERARAHHDESHGHDAFPLIEIDELEIAIATNIRLQAVKSLRLECESSSSER